MYFLYWIVSDNFTQYFVKYESLRKSCSHPIEIQFELKFAVGERNFQEKQSQSVFTRTKSLSYQKKCLFLKNNVKSKHAAGSCDELGEPSIKIDREKEQAKVKRERSERRKFKKGRKSLKSHTSRNRNKSPQPNFAGRKAQAVHTVNASG